MGNVKEFVGAEPPTEDDFIVITPKPGVKVYPNQNDMIVLKNFGDAYRDEDDMNYVVIHPDDAELVAKSLLEMARDIKGQSTF
jgi:hypothetical protein